MTLLAVHKLMITLAVVFCAGFAVRGLVVGVRGGGALHLVLAVLFAGAAVGLAAYLRWLLRSKGKALGQGARGHGGGAGQPG